MEESTAKSEGSLAAPMIFIIVLALQFLSRYFEINKKKGSTSSEDMQLRAEIKQLLKEASALSQPSTFAQAAKLRRLATAKEKELAKTSISKQLVQPFGKMLSWRAGGPANENVMVGIIPWLILSTRVGKSISRRIFK